MRADSIRRAWRRSPREKAIDSVNPRDLPPGKYTVILEPAAVLDTVGFMFWDFGGSALLEQRSFLNDRIGTQLFGENITVWDDVYHPLQTGMPFDGEGMKRHRVKLIDKGVVQRVTIARSSAQRMRAVGAGRQGGPVDAYRPWLRAAQRNRRSAAEHRLRSARGRCSAIGRTDDRLHRARHPGHPPLVHPRSRSLRENSYRHDARRHIPGGKRQGCRAASATSASTKA